jgi:hypothetical protein
LYGFPGAVQVNVLERLKEKATCIHFPEWLKYIFLGERPSYFKGHFFSWGLILMEFFLQILVAKKRTRKIN